MRALILASLALVSACASSAPPADPPPAASAAAPAPQPSAAAPAREMAPIPYTADELRDGCPPGRKIVFRVVEDGKPEKLRTIEFVKGDAAGADFKVTDADTKGNVIKTSDNHATWAELRTHAEFPRDGTVITQRTNVGPLGTLEVVVYRVTEGTGADEAVTTYHFAKKMPGPPILHFTEKGGKRVFTSTMESSTTPK